MQLITLLFDTHRAGRWVAGRRSGSRAAGPLKTFGLLVLLFLLPLGALGQTVELILQDPLEFSTPADRCANQMCTRLIELIDEADSSLDFAVYGARNQSAILHALLRAKDRGVEIRGYVDRDADDNNYYSSTNDWVQRIGNIRTDHERESRCREFITPVPLACELPPEFDGPRQCSAYRVGDRYLAASHASREQFGLVNQIMHHKFFVADGQWLWTGSANISDSGSGGYHANAVLVIHSPEVAQAYTREFDRLWNRAEGDCDKETDGPEAHEVGDAEVVTWFSPQDRTLSRGVATLIARAQHKINAGVFFLTSKVLTADLIAAHNRGVEVRVIVDATSAKNGYTKHEILREAGITVKVENWGGKMHMKSASIDEEYFIGGSMNWTSAGEYTNDENSLLIRSRRLASQFDGYFEQLWESIPARWQEPDARPDPESLQSGNSCFDGVDNDFDNLADAEDPGCSDNPPELPALPPHQWLHTRNARDFAGEYRVSWPTRCRTDIQPWYICQRPSRANN